MIWKVVAQIGYTAGLAEVWSVVARAETYEQAKQLALGYEKVRIECERVLN